MEGGGREDRGEGREEEGGRGRYEEGAGREDEGGRKEECGGREEEGGIPVEEGRREEEGQRGRGSWKKMGMHRIGHEEMAKRRRSRGMRFLLREEDDR